VRGGSDRLLKTLRVASQSPGASESIV
jgi:hypothetical protein